MRAALIATATLLALLGAAAGIGWWWVTTQWDQPLTQAASTPQQVVSIPPGSTLRAASRQLEQAGIVRHGRLLEWLGRQQHSAKRIHPGEYQFSPAMTPRQILNKLVRGEVVLHPVTLPEGLTVAQIIKRLVAAGFGRAEDYQTALADPIRRATHRIVVRGVKVPYEGYLFPDTYLFARGTPPASIIDALLKRLNEAFTPAHHARMATLGWSRHQTLTLASLIEKETADPTERKQVSAVFHNRLNRNMRLQTDPTVIYAIPDYDGNIRRADLKRNDPYNTYRHRGLPPGPIATPGAAAIDAALNPAHDSALYFVSRGDGSHVFSNTISQHNRAVRRFQLRH